MSMKGKDATLKDLRRINHIVEWIKERESRVVFSHIGKKEELQITGIGDASYRSDSKSIGGSLILLGNKKNEKAVPIYWKSKSISKVCHSAKAAETRNMVTFKDDALFFAGQVSKLILGEDENKLKVKMFTDSIPLLESIGSTKQVEEKMLRNSISDFKEDLENGLVESYSWLQTQEMLADVLTKECRNNRYIVEVQVENVFKNALSERNKVVLGDGEIRLINRVTR